MPAYTSTLLLVCIVTILNVREVDNLEDISGNEGNYPPADKLVFSPQVVLPYEPTQYTSEQRDIVDRLNEGRRDVTPTATDMMKVDWDDDLATAAANVLDSCFFSVSLTENINLLVDKSVIQATGITKNYSFYLPEALSFWLDLGKDDYVYESFDCQADDTIICKMYKLLTWSTMYKVGCSQRFCPVLFDSFSSNTEENYIYWKCNYANIGRFWGDGYSYSSGGEACSECLSGEGWCNRGLCVDSCSATDNDCYCAIDTDCSSNGQFSEEDCSCMCDAGFIGNNCLTNIYATSTSNASRSVLEGPFYSSTTSSSALVLATSSQMPTHPTVVSAFLTNKNVVLREKRDDHGDVDTWTMDSSTYQTDQSTDSDTGGTREWGSTLGATTTETYDETTVDEETTVDQSTPFISTTDYEETTVEQSTLVVSTTAFNEETTPHDSPTPFDTTFGSTPEQTSTDHDETTEEVTEPIDGGPDGLAVRTTDEVTTIAATTDQLCSLSCGGAGRLDGDTCSCVCDVEGYTYNYTEAACLVCGYEVPCNGNGILDVDTCTCYCASGYHGPSCEEICNVTTPGCWDDYSSPEDELDDDYCPVYCPHCDDCSEMTCDNDGEADKITGFEEDAGMCRCYCPLPWSGLNCDECNLTCLNGGSLNFADCSCWCRSGSSGIDCSDTCIQTSLLCTNNASLHCDLPLIAKSCPRLCGTCY